MMLIERAKAQDTTLPGALPQPCWSGAARIPFCWKTR